MIFTEDELREAMQHSAGRAESIADTPRPARRRFALPALAAATVVAVSVGAVLVTDGHHSPTSRRPAAATSPPKVVPTAVATPTVHTKAGPRPPHHVPADISGVLDAVQLNAAGYTNWLLGGNGDVARGSSNIERGLPNTNQDVQLNIVGPRADFDASRIPRDHPVAIAGTTGYYSHFALFPLDGSANDKYSAAWTIAFRTPAGDWAFVSIEKVDNQIGDSVADPAAIVAAYDRLGVRFAANASRVPLRTGYLPAGLTLVNTSFATGGADSGLVDAPFTAGSKILDIQLAPTASEASPGGLSCLRNDRNCASANGVVGGYRVVVDARGFDEATVRKVLSTLEVRRPAEQARYWTLAQAFG